MPRFTSYLEADAWRAVHAPPRKVHETSVKKLAEAAEKNAGFPQTPAADITNSPPPAGAPSPAEPRDPPPERIDVDKFVDRESDFDALMIRQAEELPQIAHGLMRKKAALGEAGAISAAIKNWHEASKAAADVREKFIAIQQETRALIPIDDVEDVVATELREVRKVLRKLGARVAAAANPDNPPLAQRAVDTGVDECLLLFEHVVERTKLELRPQEAEAV